jgi:hypothetical protein
MVDVRCWHEAANPECPLSGRYEKPNSVEIDPSGTFALSALERTRNSATQSRLSIFAQEAMAESRIGR